MYNKEHIDEFVKYIQYDLQFPIHRRIRLDWI